MKITPIIGLEVHVELETKSKMFCSCSAKHFQTEPNTHTCPVCLGLPGALPVPNKTACEWCIKLGLALGCTINEETFFERKNYFYPDLAKSYQITQLEKPFAVNGSITVDGKSIRINRAHQEEDTGKSVHMNVDLEDVTLLDFNRSGVPLVEIVSEPDIDSPEMAKSYLLKIQQIVRYIGISDADIEKGSMRCEPTVNLKIEDDQGQIHFTPLVEVKNVASLTGVQNAIAYEIDRQSKAWQESGEEKNSTNKTTRGWDADKGVTFLQREKEGSADYRYFPEPDIPPIIFTAAQIEEIKRSLPELPDQKLERYRQEFGLSEYDAKVLSSDSTFSQAYDQAVGSSPSKEFAKFVANLFLGSIKTYLNETQTEIDLSKVNPSHFLDLFKAVSESSISSSVAKQVYIESYQSGSNPVDIAREKGLIQVSDLGALEELAREVIASNPKAVEDYKKNPLSIGFFVGQLMRLSKGSANPVMAKEILEKLLSSN